MSAKPNWEQSIDNQPNKRLSELFQAIDDEPTSKLSELAKVAGLNLAEDYVGVDLSGEDLSRDNLRGANFEDSNLSKSNLSYSDLSGASLKNSNLSGADLQGTNLSNANLSGADLRGANLSNTNLSGANLEDTKFDQTHLLAKFNPSVTIDSIKEFLGEQAQRGTISNTLVSYNFECASFGGGFAGRDYNGDVINYPKNMNNYSQKVMKLLQVLIDHFSDREKPGQHLKALIAISQIKIDTAGLDYNLPVRELIPAFYAKLLQNKDNYLQFLEVFKSHLTPNSDETLFINDLIQDTKNASSEKNQETSPNSQPSEPLTLISSSSGVHYRKLQQFLSLENWREADNETVKVMLQAANRVKEQCLREKDIFNLPSEDLNIINRLWLDHSKGKFGFSVQAKIYRSLGGTREYNKEIWEQFGDCVGWRRNGSWIWYPHIDFSLNAPSGHLPGASYGISGNDVDIFRDFLNNPWGWISSWGLGNWGLGASTLFSRPDLIKGGQ